MSVEEWKKCFENYEISNWGNCRRGQKNISGSINNRGYRYFQIQRGNKRINILFHTAVAECFIGSRNDSLVCDHIDSLVCDHIDRNKLNNNVNNLRYITQKENCKNQDRYRKDIIEEDPIERKRIMERLRSKEKHKNSTKRTRGTGGIIARENGTFQAVITLNGIKYIKTFKTKKEAEDYLDNLISSPEN
jgi:hypothetical protein